MSAMAEVVLGTFDAGAQQALRVARAVAERNDARLFDSRLLLAGLADDAGLWPNNFDVAAVRRLARERDMGGTEMRGKTTLRGLPLSREVEVVFEEAAEFARHEPVGTAHLLLALAGSGGSEATLLLRHALHENDPWARLRPYVTAKLVAVGEAEGEPSQPSEPGVGPGRERVVALLYVLARDEVPFGKLTAMVNSISSIGDLRVAYTNEHAERLARDLVDRLWQ